ncbi:hypothetical protein ACFTXM_35445 [Streptomyces sp. NPDC056930]|uniref:hypothetical protein n=1 Tax=Streptomyces sp. NPDC056930 TaxID=3345967 RepID=UPI00363B04C0
MLRGDVPSAGRAGLLAAAGLRSSAGCLAQRLAAVGDAGVRPAVARCRVPAADARTARLATQVRRLEQCPSEALGEQVWREVGIRGLDDTEQLKARITTLEQQAIDLELKLQERDDDLAAAHAANRELVFAGQFWPH